MTSALLYLNSFTDPEHAIENIKTQNIKVASIPCINAYMLNYEQIGSNPNGFTKRNPVLMDCRNLVVRYDTALRQWGIISKSFSRFFNWNENESDTYLMTTLIGQKRVTAFEKLDGSLITMSFIDGEWRIFTRGAYADTNPFRGMPNAFTNQPRDENDTFGRRVRKYVDIERLNQNYYYVFELCTPGAHITNYDTERLYLLSVIDSATHQEVQHPLPDEFTRIAPNEALIDLPKSFLVESMIELFDTLSKQSKDFEGYVLSANIDDSKDAAVLGYVQPGIPFRIKLKSDSYLTLHYHGTKKVTLPDLCEIVVSNEQDEVLSYSITSNPEYASMIAKITKLYDTALHAMAVFYLDNISLKKGHFAQILDGHVPIVTFTDTSNTTDNAYTSDDTKESSIVTSIVTPLPSQDHPAVPKYHPITPATFTPFKQFYFKMYADQKTFITKQPGDCAAKIKNTLGSEATKKKASNSLATLVINTNLFKSM